jgi:type IV secretory pathway VirB10-like protein
MDAAEETAKRAGGTVGQTVGDERIHDQPPEVEGHEEHPGGGRFNQRLLIVFVGAAMIVGVVAIQGIRSAGVSTPSAAGPSADGGANAARDKAEVDELAAGAARPKALPAETIAPAAVMPTVQTQAVQRTPREPSRYAQWAQDKYMKALEAPEMVAAFHGGSALEIPRAQGGGENSANFNGGISSDPTVTLHPPASPYTVMAGNVIPAVLIGGINSDLPGPVLAQVSENVFDSASGRSLLIPQGTRLIGAYQSAAAYGQQRVQIAWRRLIFPNTSSMDLPQMPGTDQAGYSGFTDEVNNHYVATFGTAALMSLISAGQMVGQMAAFGGGGTYGAYGYYQPNQWAMAGETAGSAASAQMGGVGQQMIGNGLNRPPTIEIRPGYQFNVMVTEDLAFPGPYKG